LIGGVVAISFCHRLIQPIQDQPHLAFEYWGQSDPTRVMKRKVSKAEMTAWVKSIFGRRIRNGECPKALEMYHPSDPVRLRLRFISKIALQFFFSSNLGLIKLSCLDFPASRGHLPVLCTSAQRGLAELQGPRRGGRAGSTTTAHRRIPL
jgi:hypothetical protein